MKYHWLTAIKSLLFVAGFGVYSMVNANHILGGEVQYTHVSGKKYKFTVKLYRNCNECEFNTGNCADVKNLDIYASPEELSYAKKLGIIPLSKVSRKDVTPLCKGTADSCQGGSFTNGIEEWVFEGYYDFDTITDYCRFEVGIRVETRLDAWQQSLNEAFYNYARLNVCNGNRNNSPEFRAPVYYLLPENQSFTYNILARDADGDSLSYKLVKAQKAWGTSVTYPTAYTATKPLDIYCTTSSCDLDKTKWPIDGMGIEKESGWMGFTPVKNGQTAFIVVEVTEWRKVNGVWIAEGVTRRDMQVEVIDAGNYVPKIATSAFDYFACAGNNFNADFSVSDALYNLIKDSVSMYIYSDLPGTTLTKVGTAKNNFDAFVLSPVSLNQIRSNPYYTTIVVTDDHCPLLGSTYKTLSITVTGVPKSATKVAFKECNKIEFGTSATGNEYTHNWFLFRNDKLLESRSGANGIFEVPDSGAYVVRHQIVNSNTRCQTEVNDTVQVPAFSLFTPAIIWPENVCKNQPVILGATFKGGTPDYTYWWNGAVGSDSLKLILDKDSLIHLEVRDKIGCRMSFSKNLKLFSPVSILTNDTSMCLPADAYLVSLNNRVAINPIGLEGNYGFQYLDNGGQITSYGSKYFFTPTKSAIHHFDFKYTDANGCNYNTAFSIHVITPSPTGIQTPAPLCSNDPAVELNSRTKCILTGGNWKSNIQPLAITNGYFDPKASGAGSFDLIYSKNDLGCIIRDTAFIEVNKAPAVHIVKPTDSVYCSSANNIFLSAFPAGGVWKNNVTSPMPNLFSPADISVKGFTSAQFTYSYTDKLNGCKSSDYIRLKVNPAPEIMVLPRYEMCSGTEFLFDPKAKNIDNLSLDGDFALFQVKRLDDSYLFTGNDVDQRTTVSFRLKASGLLGCADKMADFTIDLKPMPSIALSSLPAAGCAPLTTLLKVESLNKKANPDEFFWAEGRNWVSGASLKPLTLISSGSYSYEAKASLQGCVSAVAKTSINVYPSPQVAFETEPKSRIVTTDFSMLTFKDVTVSATPYTRYWQFEHGSPITSDKARVSVDFPKDTGLYNVRLSIKTDEGCEGNASQNIRVRPGLQFFVPNAFTPDRKGPDQNEVFRVVMDSAVTFHLTVLNRWGQIIFTAENQEKGWDGIYQGNKLPAGVYVWEVEATTIYGSYVLKRGTVSLLR